MIRIDGSPLPSTSQDANLQSNTGPQTGTYRGEVAFSESLPSLLTDAAEELCLFAAEKLEHKTLDEREIETESPIAILHAEEITAYLDAAKTFDDPQKLAALCKRMQSSQGSPRQIAREETRDPTGQYLLLQYALQDGLKNGTPEQVLDNLREAIADLETDSGPQIRSCLNTVGAAAEFGVSRTGIESFQAAYHDVVLGEATLAQTLNLVLERLAGHEGENFVRGLQSLIKALGQDLAATRPSSEPTHLQSLVQDLYQLEVTVTVIDHCKALAKTLADRHEVADFPVIGLMKEMVGLTGEKWVSASRFSALAIRFGIHTLPAEITLLAASLHILRQLPLKVFPDTDIRQSILGAAQEALDGAIDQEEE